MNNSSIVSVIVPCYNEDRYVEETLQSIKNQTYKKLECIVVNDGSTDKSLQKISKFCKSDSRFVFFDRKNEGVSEARNYAIRKSNGKYILPIDADDIIDPTFIEKGIRILEDHPDYRLVYCDVRQFGMSHKHMKLPEYSLETEIMNNCIPVSAIYRRCDFDKTSGYDSNMQEGLEDWDFWLSLLNPMDKVYKINQELFFYRIKKNSRNKNINFNTLCVLHKRMWEKHRHLYNLYYQDPVKSLEFVSIFQYKDSIDFKLGHCLLAPIRCFKSLLDQCVCYLRKLN